MEKKPDPAAYVHRAGYRHGMKQPGLIVSLQLEQPAAVNYEALDPWLRRAFDATMEEPAADEGDDADQAAVRALAWRVAHLGTALLRALKIPALGGCHLVQVVHRSGRSYEVKIAAPRVDRVAERVYEAAFQQAARAVHWMIGRTEDAATTAKLHGLMEQGFLKTFQAMLRGSDVTVPMMQAAFSLDIPFRHLGSGIFQLGWGSAARRLDRGAIQIDSAIGARMVQDKWLSAHLMRDAGLPAPVHRRVATPADALNAARALGWPVVLKPVDRDRGEGVTVDVASEAMLEEAFTKAAAFSRNLLVERQVSGVCHRVVVADGEVVLVSKRLPKSVKGDGVHTVEQLVARANELEMARPPWVRLNAFPLDELALQNLAMAGLSPESVPAEGQFVPLRRIQSTEWGGVVEYWTDTMHPDNVAIAVKAARLFGLALAGIDIISDDISRPWHENGAILNEVNYSSLLPARHAPQVLPVLVRKFFAGDGRIPVEMVVGGPAALAEGARIRSGYAQRGLRCHLASHDRVVAADGAPVVLGAHGLFGRAIALLLDSQVDALVLVVQSDELLATGLPVDRITRVTEVADAQGARWLPEMRALLAPYRTDSM